MMHNLYAAFHNSICRSEKIVPNKSEKFWSFITVRFTLPENIFFCMFKEIQNELQFDESSKRPAKVKLAE